MKYTHLVSICEVSIQVSLLNQPEWTQYEWTNQNINRATSSDQQTDQSFTQIHWPARKIYEIWDFQRGEKLDCSLLTVCKAWVFRWLPTFRRDLLPLSSTQKTESAVLDCGLLSFDIIYPWIGRFGGIYCLHPSPEDEIFGFKLYWLAGFWRCVISVSKKSDTSTFCPKIQTVGSFKQG